MLTQREPKFHKGVCGRVSQLEGEAYNWNNIAKRRIFDFLADWFQCKTERKNQIKFKVGSKSRVFKPMQVFVDNIMEHVILHINVYYFGNYFLNKYIIIYNKCVNVVADCTERFV